MIFEKLSNKKLVYQNPSLVQEVGLEPTRPQWALQLKCNVSTYSTTPA